jgi:D-alanyl-D-alanine carboxypeptidase
MMKITWFRLFLIVIMCGASVTSYATCSPNLNAGIQQILDADRELYGIPGIQVSVLCPEDTVPRDFVSGSTTVEGDTPLQPTHIFQLGSETKSFVAVTLLQLESQGLLSLDDPLGKWLTDIPESWRSITIRQVLNHTSGIYNYTDVLEEKYLAGETIEMTKNWSSKELLELVENRPFYFPPGQGWHYTNTNYVLAGMVIEKITGQPVGDVLMTRWVQPLQLSSMLYVPHLFPDSLLNNVAHGYSDRGYFVDEPKDVTFYTNSWANAAGSMDGTSHDVALWLRHLVRGELLPQSAMTELASLVDLYDGQPLPTNTQAAGNGLGIFQDSDLFNERAWWHLGGTLGYMSLMVWLSCHDVVVATDTNHLTYSYDIYLVTRDIISYIQSTSPNQQCVVTHAPQLTAQGKDTLKHAFSAVY